MKTTTIVVVAVCTVFRCGILLARSGKIEGGSHVQRSTASICTERAEQERRRNGAEPLRFRLERLIRPDRFGLMKLEATIRNVGTSALWVNGRPSAEDTGIDSERQVFVAFKERFKHSGRQLIVDRVTVRPDDYVLLQPGQEQKIRVGFSAGTDIRKSIVSLTMCYWDRTTIAASPMQGKPVFTGPISISADIPVLNETE